MKSFIFLWLSGYFRQALSRTVVADELLENCMRVILSPLVILAASHSQHIRLDVFHQSFNTTDL